MKPEDRDEIAAMGALHRQASAEIDAAPAPAVRAAVLAAAARAVDAKPHDAAQAPAASPFGRRRWPVSMAALLVVSLMTGLVVQAMREDPERVVSAGPRVPAPASTTAPDPHEAVPNSATPDRPVPSEPRPASVAKPGRAHADGGRSADGFARDATPAATQRPAPDQPAPSQKVAATPLPAPASPRGAVAPPPPAAPAAATRSGDESAAAEASRPAVNTAQRLRRGAEPLTPEAWVDRIVKLRDAGDGAAADRELDALRTRYPDFEIPAAAFGAAGTR